VGYLEKSEIYKDGLKKGVWTFRQDHTLQVTTVTV
jgi:hypothetical protein